MYDGLIGRQICLAAHLASIVDLLATGNQAMHAGFDVKAAVALALSLIFLIGAVVRS